MAHRLLYIYSRETAITARPAPAHFERNSASGGRDDAKSDGGGGDLSNPQTQTVSGKQAG